jgi:GTP pyrophosphokinase
MEKRLEKLLKKVRSYHPTANLDLIKKAYEFAQIAHAGQKRLSGDPVSSHFLAVAETLADLKLDLASITAGLLHDVIEDAGVTSEEIKKEFGKEVTFLVEGVTKVGNLKLRGESEEEFIENLRKMILVMARDLRVVFIRLADRLHNLRTLEYLAKEKQVRIARETLEIYAPLADRMQIGRLKGELEDLAFPYVYPEEYQWLIAYSAPFFKKRKKDLKEAIEILKTLLKRERIKAEINGRPKHLYSLWQKLLRPGIDRDIEKIFDLVAVRVLAESIRNCYASLGVIHKIWKPIPQEGVSDFIAQPKPNGYRSIHSRVFGPGGRILEVQIRTYEMHEEAEAGIAAHWFYEEKKSRSKGALVEEGFFAPNEKLEWVKELVGWQKEIVDSKEFLEALKFDALAGRIFVFSPKGDVYDLPLGATPVDFAYAVHTDLGNRIEGAKVNGKMVAISAKLRNSDVVEILTRKKSQPSKKWLEFVVTTAARREILKFLRKESLTKK